MAKKNQSPNDRVQIRHKSANKDSETATTTRKAFDQIWKAKGWEIVEREDAKATTSANPSN